MKKSNKRNDEKMVIITDPTFKNLQENKKNNIIYHDPTVRQNKSMKIQLRLTPAIEQQLRQYAEIKGTTVTDAVETIVYQKFYNKKINREYFNLEKTTPILVPKDVHLLAEYENKKINLVSHITETSNEVYNIALFDKQEDLFTSNPEDYEVMTIHQVNNAYDTYDEIEECFYSTYNLPADANKFLNHTGLIVILREDNDDDFNTNRIRLAIFTHTYNGELLEARVILYHEAVKLAGDSNNLILKEYLENTEEIIQLEKIENMTKVNSYLDSMCSNLQQENEELKNSLANQEAEVSEQLQQRLLELQEENQKLKEERKNFDELVNKRIIEALRKTIGNIEIEEWNNFPEKYEE